MPGIVRAGARGQAAAEDARREAQLPGARAGHGQSRSRVRAEPPCRRAVHASTCSSGSPRGSLATSLPESRRVPTCGGEMDSPLGRTQYVVDHDAAARRRAARLRARLGHHCRGETRPRAWPDSGRGAQGAGHRRSHRAPRTIRRGVQRVLSDRGADDAVPVPHATSSSRSASRRCRARSTSSSG